MQGGRKKFPNDSVVSQESVAAIVTRRKAILRHQRFLGFEQGWSVVGYSEIPKETSGIT
jgi:hypothetical protein